MGRDAEVGVEGIPFPCEDEICPTPECQICLAFCNLVHF